MRWLVRERLYRQWWVCWGFAYSTYRVAYGVVYRASSVAHFDKEISHSEVIQLSSVVWIYRRALDCYRASSNPLSSFTRVPHDKESAVVQSLKPKVARSVLLDCSFYAVPRGVLKLQSVSSRMPLLQCVVEYCWSIHVGWHRPPPHGSRRRGTAGDGTSAWQQATVLDGRKWHQCVATQISISQPAKKETHINISQPAKGNPATRCSESRIRLARSRIRLMASLLSTLVRIALLAIQPLGPRCTAHTPRVARAYIATHRPRASPTRTSHHCTAIIDAARTRRLRGRSHDLQHYRARAAHARRARAAHARRLLAQGARAAIRRAPCSIARSCASHRSARALRSCAHAQSSERSIFDAAAHEVKMLMMYTRASFYATEPSNAAAYVPVEASYLVRAWPGVPGAADLATADLTTARTAAAATHTRPPAAVTAVVSADLQDQSDLRWALKSVGAGLTMGPRPSPIEPFDHKPPRVQRAPGRAHQPERRFQKRHPRLCSSSVHDLSAPPPPKVDATAGHSDEQEQSDVRWALKSIAAGLTMGPRPAPSKTVDYTPPRVQCPPPRAHQPEQRFRKRHPRSCSPPVHKLNEPPSVEVDANVSKCLAAVDAFQLASSCRRQRTPSPPPSPPPSQTCEPVALAAAVSATIFAGAPPAAALATAAETAGLAHLQPLPPPSKPPPSPPPSPPDTDGDEGSESEGAEGSNAASEVEARSAARCAEIMNEAVEESHSVPKGGADISDPKPERGDSRFGGSQAAYRREYRTWHAREQRRKKIAAARFSPIPAGSIAPCLDPTAPRQLPSLRHRSQGRLGHSRVLWAALTMASCAGGRADGRHRRRTRPHPRSCACISGTPRAAAPRTEADLRQSRVDTETGGPPPRQARQRGTAAVDCLRTRPPTVRKAAAVAL